MKLPPMIHFSGEVFTQGATTLLLRRFDAYSAAQYNKPPLLIRPPVCGAARDEHGPVDH